jgi:hypothetical protein
MAAPLSTEEQNQLFKQFADSHIDVANTQLKTGDLHLVNSGFIYGAARFNAFAIASSSKNLQEYNHNRQDAIQHYTEIFQNMLEENLNNYQSAFTSTEEESSNKPRYAHLQKK